MKKLLSLLIILSFTISIISPQKVEAATLKLNKTKATMEADSTLQLKLGKIDASKSTWKTSNKKVATISKKGLITAKAEGTATITATYNKKKYTCKVTVVDNNKPINTNIIAKGDVLFGRDSKNSVVITYQKQEIDSSGNLDITLLVENKYSDNITFQCDYVTVNDYEFSDITMDAQIAKGETASVVLKINDFDSTKVDNNNIIQFGAQMRVLKGDSTQTSEYIMFSYAK